MEELIGKMKKDMAAAAPDVSGLLTNPSIDPGPEPHTIQVGDQVIDGRSDRNTQGPASRGRD